MPFIASYTTSYKARRSGNTDAWTPDGGVFRATSGLSFWIDGSDTSSYTQGWSNGWFGINSITDKASNNAITINDASNGSIPVARDSQNGVPSSMKVIDFNGSSFTTGDFAQVDSDGNHWSIALVRAGDNSSSAHPYNSYHGTFWSLENNDPGHIAAGIKRDYGLELGDDVAETSSSNTYFYGQLALDSRPANVGTRINEDEVVQSLTNTSRNLLRFDNHGNGQDLRNGGVWFIMAIVFNKTGDEILVRVDGENMFTPVPYDAKLNTELSVRIAVNRLYDSNNTNMKIQIAEFMTFAGKPGTGGTDLSEVEKVEGYLAHKWDNQSLLPTTHPYRNYSLASKGDWNPSQGFPNMDTAFWIDASDEDSWNMGGSTIDSVTDKSGNYTLSIDGDSGGLWRGSSFAGNYYFHFRGNTGISTTSTSVQASNGNHWAIGVMRWESIVTSNDAFWQLDDTSNLSTSYDYSVESRGTMTTQGWLGETNFGASDISSTSGAEVHWTSGVDHNVWSIIAVYFNKTGTQIGARVNGTNAHTPLNDYANSISTNQEVHVFKGIDGNFLKGDLAEFFTFADIPGTGGTDISFIEIAEGYLAHKWNDVGLGQDVLNRLPNDHPFKNSAP